MPDLTHPEAERAVLAAFLIDPSAIADTEGSIRGSDFAAERHRLIFEAIHALHSTGQPADVRTVQAKLEQAGKFEAAGGIAYLVGLDMDLPDLSRVQTYARIVVDAAIRRRLAYDLRGVLFGLEQASEATPDALSKLDLALRAANEAVAVDELLHVSEGLEDILARLDRPLPQGIVGIPTGYRELDTICQGFSPGELIIVAARPGVGKTALASCMAVAAAKLGHSGAIFSIEMNRAEIQGRVISAESSVPLRKIQTGRMGPQERDAVRRAIRTIAGLPLTLQATQKATVGRIGAIIRQAKRTSGIQFAVIDYLGLIEPDAGAENRHMELSRMSRALKSLAAEMQIPIIALHQLNRANVGRKPIASDLRESGSIEQDADKVILIYRQLKNEPIDQHAPPSDQAEVIVAKFRNGDTGSVFLKNSLAFFRFDPIGTEAHVEPQASIYGGER